MSELCPYCKKEIAFDIAMAEHLDASGAGNFSMDCPSCGKLVEAEAEYDLIGFYFSKTDE